MAGHVAIIGGGVIGGGWAARFALMGWEVRVFDPAPEAARRVQEVLAGAREALPCSCATTCASTSVNNPSGKKDRAATSAARALDPRFTSLTKTDAYAVLHSYPTYGLMRAAAVVLRATAPVVWASSPPLPDLSVIGSTAGTRYCWCCWCCCMWWPWPSSWLLLLLLLVVLLLWSVRGVVVAAAVAANALLTVLRP